MKPPEERHPRAKSNIGRLLQLNRDKEAREYILRTAKGAGTSDGPAISDAELCERLGVHRQSLWRYVQRLDGIKSQIEDVYANALLATAGEPNSVMSVVLKSTAKQYKPTTEEELAELAKLPRCKHGRVCQSGCAAEEKCTCECEMKSGHHQWMASADGRASVSK